MTTRLLAIAVPACLALAAASLLAPAAPAYDAWAWLVWGRELASLRLDTSSGPSWKPLPVAVAALLAPAGEAAPVAWLVLVRASFLLSLVLAGALAHRLTAGLASGLRWCAAGFAGLCLALLFDEITAWTRQAAIGMSEPLLVALVLGAVAAALEARPRLALGLAALAALIRPEVWPLLLAYGVWCWRADRTLRPWLVALAVAVPALWIVPDMLASGAAGAGERALRGDGTPLQALFEVLARAAAMPLAAAWPLAAFAVLGAVWQRGAGARVTAIAPRARAADEPATAPVGERTTVMARRAAAADEPAAAPAGGLAAGGRDAQATRILAAGALAWIAVVALMAAGGFAGLPRFMAPALAVVGVLAGVGLARLAAHRRGALALALAAVLAVTLAQLPSRVGNVTRALASSDGAAQRKDRLRALVREVGREPLLRCGRLASSSTLVRTALAWELRVPLADVVSFGDPPRRSGAFVVGPGASVAVRVRLSTRGKLLGERGEWRAYSLDCSPAAAASGSRSAGVVGARR